MAHTDGNKSCTSVEATGGLAVTKTMDKLCSSAECSLEQPREEHTSSTSSPEANQTFPAKPLITGSEDGVPQGSTSAAKERTVEQIREEGWGARDAENVTLAELYLMSGKPGKLQLEYEWQSITLPHNPQENGQASAHPKPHRKQRVLRCLLRLVATEVNPKPLAPELCSTATSPLKTHQEEQNQALAQPGKGPIAIVRSPSCGRQQASVRGARLHLPNIGSSGGRNLPRCLLGSTAGSDSEGGVFAVPTTLPPNSSRHNRMFSPNKEAELALRQSSTPSVCSQIFSSLDRENLETDNFGNHL